MTDEGVGELAAGCPQLSSLNLLGCTKVTDEGVESLRMVLPSCDVEEVWGEEHDEDEDGDEDEDKDGDDEEEDGADGSSGNDREAP